MDIGSSIDFIIDEVTELKYLDEEDFDNLYVDDIIDEARELKNYFQSSGFLSVKKDLEETLDRLNILENSIKSKLTEFERVDLMLIKKDLAQVKGVFEDD